MWEVVRLLSQVSALNTIKFYCTLARSREWHIYMEKLLRSLVFVFCVNSLLYACQMEIMRIDDALASYIGPWMVNRHQVISLLPLVRSINSFGKSYGKQLYIWYKAWKGIDGIVCSLSGQ